MNSLGRVFLYAGITVFVVAGMSGCFLPDDQQWDAVGVWARTGSLTVSGA